MASAAKKPRPRRARAITDKDLDAYLRLDKAELRDQYVVIVNGRVVSTGHDIERMLRSARRRYPRSVPFVAKAPGEVVLVL
ncbi:MAG: DUF5678 domain-containing protein [Candidatus Binatia bacterium]|jgi:hypothetical protein